jgi:hypothetical protein
MAIYLRLKRALYRCLKSALLCWKHFSGNLIKRGYILNPYDSCVANKEIDGSQFTIIWHVDNLNLSHKSNQVLDNEVKYLESIYISVVGSKGTEHTYLGMDLKFQSQKLQVSMIPYLQDIVNEFPNELDKITSTPAALYLFEVSEDAKLLDSIQRKYFIIQWQQFYGQQFRYGPIF